jgi:nicotinate phosphoribosyltransferase
MKKETTYSPNDLSVMDLDQIYMASSLWYDGEQKNHIGVFDLVVRDMPKHRNFMVFTGLDEIVTTIQDWKYTDEQIKLLKKYKLISNKFAQYLKQFSFSGDVHAMSEGTLFFPGEPVIRITAPLIEGNLLTAFLITALSSNVIYASKFIRSVIAAKEKSVIGVAPQRAHSFESAYKAQRASAIVGSKNVPSPIVRDKLNIEWGDPSTIAYHAFISSYPTEYEAMQKAAEFAKFDLSLMIDTYDLKKGLQNAIQIIKDRKKKKLGTKIVIDSGNLAQQCKYVRKELDKKGLKNTPITLASNLDEYKIKKLMEKNIPADTFIVNTEALVSRDDPGLEVVFKLAQVRTKHGIINKMKLSKGKRSYPGEKQVFRVEKGKKFQKDVIGLSKEKLGVPLQKQVIKKGKVVYSSPSVSMIQKHIQVQLKKLSPRFLDISKEYQYPVAYSNELKQLEKRVEKDIRKQYT